MRSTPLGLSAVFAAIITSAAFAQTLPSDLSIRFADESFEQANFSSPNAWISRTNSSRTLSASDSGTPLNLIFRAKVTADYVVTNDLSTDENAFAVHAMTLAPAATKLGESPASVRIDGRTIQLQPDADGAPAQVVLGARDPKRSHAVFDIALDLIFAEDLQITGNGNQVFRISGMLREATPGAALTKTGTASLELTNANKWTGPTIVRAGNLILRDGDSIGSGALSIEAGGVVAFDGIAPRAGLSTALEVAAKAKLDLNGNAWVIDHAADASPIESIRKMIGDGRIVTSAINPNQAVICINASTMDIAQFANRALDADAVIIAVARFGDTNLDGAVDITDLKRVKDSFNKPGAWTNGDFNSDGKVDFDDLLKLSQNYDAKDSFDADWKRLQAAAVRHDDVAMIRPAH